jgi:hypothetical protein
MVRLSKKAVISLSLDAIKKKGPEVSKEYPQAPDPSNSILKSQITNPKQISNAHSQMTNRILFNFLNSIIFVIGYLSFGT